MKLSILFGILAFCTIAQQKPIEDEPTAISPEMFGDLMESIDQVENYMEENFANSKDEYMRMGSKFVSVSKLKEFAKFLKGLKKINGTRSKRDTNEDDQGSENTSRKIEDAVRTFTGIVPQIQTASASNFNQNAVASSSDAHNPDLRISFQSTKSYDVESEELQNRERQERLAANRTVVGLRIFFLSTDAVRDESRPEYYTPTTERYVYRSTGRRFSGRTKSYRGSTTPHYGTVGQERSLFGSTNDYSQTRDDGYEYSTPRYHRGTTGRQYGPVGQARRLFGSTDDYSQTRDDEYEYSTAGYQRGTTGPRYGPVGQASRLFGSTDS